MFPFVALDIETTGLDPRKDAIIEIGAAKYDGEQVVDTWKSLINPGRLIPDAITQLTGIDSRMVASAPPISAVIQEFADFVGDLPVLGHNVAFDLGFLNAQFDFSSNPVIDTFELASIHSALSALRSVWKKLSSQRMSIASCICRSSVIRSITYMMSSSSASRFVIAAHPFGTVFQAKAFSS